MPKDPTRPDFEDLGCCPPLTAQDIERLFQALVECPHNPPPVFLCSATTYNRIIEDALDAGVDPNEWLSRYWHRYPGYWTR